MNTNFIKFLLALKNASLSKKEALVVEYSAAREKMVKVLYHEGLIQSFALQTNSSSKRNFILIKLRYPFDKSHLKYLKLLSKPSHMKYMKLADICNIPDRKFVVFFSTDLGFLTNLECKKIKLGGKLLFVC
jgi:small subunit ribosomal protein S8